MSKQTINIGIAPADGDGDSIRVGSDKINDNFAEVYSADYLTATNQASVLPNARQLLAGTNITIDDSVSGDRTIGAAIPDEATGSYSATSTNFTPNQTFTITWVRLGHTVNLRFSGSNPNGTSNSTSFIVAGTNMPVAIRPLETTSAIGVPLVSGDSTNGGFRGYVTVGTDGTITFYRDGSATGWQNSNNKGFSNSFVSFTYSTI